jgi:hypothetical protein
VSGNLVGWQLATIESVLTRTPRLKSIFLRAELEQQLAGGAVAYTLLTVPTTDAV